MIQPAWYGCSPAPGRVDGSTSSPVAWSTLLHQVCIQLLKGREFNQRSQTFSNPVSKFTTDVKRILNDPESYRLCRPNLHEALARLYLTKGVNDTATRKEATQYVMQQLEAALPESPPKGCLHYSLDEIRRFLLHSMSHRDDTDDETAASLMQFLHMLDNYYLSQTASDPYNDFSSMHWLPSVSWVAYVVDLKRFAERHRFFQRLHSSGHKGSAPVNMDPAQVFLRQIIQTLQRCMGEDGNDSVAAELFTLYSATLPNLTPQQLLDDLEKRPKLKDAHRSPVRKLADLAPAAPVPRRAAAAAYTEHGTTDHADVDALRTNCARLQAEVERLSALTLKNQPRPADAASSPPPGGGDVDIDVFFAGAGTDGFEFPKFGPAKPLPSGMRMCLDVPKIQQAGVLAEVDFGELWNRDHKFGLVSHLECPMCPRLPWFNKFTECVEYKDLKHLLPNPDKAPSKTNKTPAHVTTYHYKWQCPGLKRFISQHIETHPNDAWMKTHMEGSDVYALLRASYDRQKAAAATAGEDRAPGTPRPGRPSPNAATPKQANKNEANKNDGDLDDDN